MTLSKMQALVALLAFMPVCSSSIHECFDSDCGVEGATAFLQMDVQAQHAVRKQEQKCGYLTPGCLGNPLTMFNNNEICHSNKADFSRSLVDVMREHPGEDGYCYFNASAMYITYGGDVPDYVAAVKEGILGLRGLGFYRGLNTGKFVTYNWEGESVSTHADLDHYLYDDLYAFSLGFLQNQGLDVSKLNDSQAMIDMSRQQCEQVQAKYNFSDDELVFNDLLDMNMPIMAQCYCAAGVPLPKNMQGPYITKKAGYNSPTDCKPVTKREFARHHYMKCVLGYKNSAADLAYLIGRACLLPGNRIGHYSECPYSPEGV